MKTTLYMVRHAESPFVFGQEKTRGLSEQGFVDANKVADVLEGVDIHFVASSTYARAVQTVQPVADRRGLPVIQYEELRERAIKGLDYKAPWEDLEKAIEKSFADIDYALDGGETTRAAQQRSMPVIDRLLREYSGKNIVVGTHGNMMTIIMNAYNSEYGFDFWKSTSKPDIYKLTFDCRNRQLETVERMWLGGEHG